ncbi:hypothetical protein [uncultured Desulfobacter sp.]|nr:hypothetical protein [uncultured Desulfobacter sp.]
MSDRTEGKCPVMHGSHTLAGTSKYRLVAECTEFGHITPTRHQNKSTGR